MPLIFSLKRNMSFKTKIYKKIRQRSIHTTLNIISFRFKNCTENTTGSNCQYCAEGFHGNPSQGKCKPCPCPSKERNFSRKCHRLHHGGFKCICKTGYSGPKCDSCKSGYYGNPEENGGSCKPCNCNKYGSASDECDEKTGQCNCRPGMAGKDCSQCESPRHVLQINGCKRKCTFLYIFVGILIFASMII